MPSLDEFRATIAGKDLARQNRFEVRITGPVKSDKQVNLLAESVSIPGQNIRSVPDDLRYGPARDHAQGVTYGDISMTFICTPGMQEKVYFEEWQKRIVQLGERDPGWNVNFYKDYVGEIQIDQLDRQNQMKYQVTIVEAWPKTINAQEFTLSSNDSYQTVSVDFAYRYWFRSAQSPAVHVPPKPSLPVDEFGGMIEAEKHSGSYTGNRNVEARQEQAAAERKKANEARGRLSEIVRSPGE